MQAEITKLSHDGRGIATVDGKITFLLGGLPEETVEFTYLKRHRSFDEGQVTHVLTPSAARVNPPCAHFGACGGCSLQHLAPQAQIQFKERALLEQLAHLGIQAKHVLPPLTSISSGYRHKARLGVKYVKAKDKVLVGFREVNGRYITDMNNCPILHPAIDLRIPQLKQLIADLEAYNTIPQIEVAVGDQAPALIFRHLQPLSAGDLEKLQQFAITEQLSIYLQPGGIDTVHPLWPRNNELLSYSLPEHSLKLHFHPTDFTQVNPAINQQMIQQALRLLALQPNEQVLDLFCGLGNFTLAMAKYCRKAIGIEGDRALVQRAADNAQLNNIANAHFYSADLTQDFLAREFAQQTFDKILLDPPRTGALNVVKQLACLKPKAIVYVSCNSATFTRDATELIQQGYCLAQLGVMDMFPHTRHVESMGLFVT